MPRLSSAREGRYSNNLHVPRGDGRLSWPGQYCYNICIAYCIIIDLKTASWRDSSHEVSAKQTWRERPVADLVVKALLPTYCTISMPFSWTLEHGNIPPTFKYAYITAYILKKVNLDLADVGWYPPISNLSVLSKLLERLISRTTVCFLICSWRRPIVRLTLLCSRS